MAGIACKFYSFSKRSNSTKQVSGSGTTYQITLREPTSIMSPVIILEAGSEAISYNYCYIPTFNRYYFIKDIVSLANGLWQIACNEDVLATWKSAITGSTQYVTRSYDHVDDLIPDTFYGGKMQYKTEKVSPTWENGLSRPFDPTEFTVIMGVICSDDALPRLGSVVYYALTQAQMEYFMDWMLGDPDYLGTNPNYGVNADMMKALVDPMTYITECYILPFRPPHMETHTSHLKIGWWEIDMGAAGQVGILEDANISGMKIFDEVQVTLPKHPQAATRGRYLNCNNYTCYTLHAGPFGDIDFSANQLCDVEKIAITVTSDFQGNAYCRIEALSSNNSTKTHRLAFIEHNIKIPIKVSSMSSDINTQSVWNAAGDFFSNFLPVGNGPAAMLGNIDQPQGFLGQAAAVMSPLGAVLTGGAMSGVFQAFTGVDSGAPVGAAQGAETVFGPNAGAGAGEFAQNYTAAGVATDPRHCNTNAGSLANGSPASVNRNWTLIATFQYVVDWDPEHCGKPYCKKIALNQLSGFTVCANADISFAGTDTELNSVKGFLNTGFYLE